MDVDPMASEVLCGRCGALLTNPVAPCPGCGAPASGGAGYRYAAPPYGAFGLFWLYGPTVELL